MQLIAAVAFSLLASFLFSDIPWSTPAQAVVKKLTDAGFHVARKPDHGDYGFRGMLLGRQATGMAFMADGKLARVVVVVTPPDESVRENYEQIRQVLVKKYGPPAKTVQRYLEPFHEGDGYEQEAIRAGKAVFATQWIDGDEDLFINITPALQVSVTYESPDWAAEAARRTKGVF
jgi:hypothetical protein